jgi:hypothetical protein
MISAAEAFSKGNRSIEDLILSDIDKYINDILENDSKQNCVVIEFPINMVPSKGSVLPFVSTFDNVISKLIDLGFSIAINDPIQTPSTYYIPKHLYDFIHNEDKHYVGINPMTYISNAILIDVIPVSISWKDPSNPKLVDARKNNTKEED